MNKYRKKPIVIEALQLRWDTWEEMCEFIDVKKGGPHGVMEIGCKIGLDVPTLEGVMHADENDYIIKGVRGEIYPCKPDIFEMTYDKVEE